jgi:hypothetical protein
VAVEATRFEDRLNILDEIHWAVGRGREDFSGFSTQHHFRQKQGDRTGKQELGFHRINP